jgi:hypothetical protein
MSDITGSQLKRLQTLWGKHASRTVLVGDSRSERLAWASQQLGHAVTSFSDLSKSDARQLIKSLHGVLGIAEEPRRDRRPIRDRHDAAAAGNDGRRGPREKSATLAAQADLDRLQDAIARLGWTQDRFESWLRSASSPLARKVNGVRLAPPDPKIVTVADANRVWWGLKPIMKRAGVWQA